MEIKEFIAGNRAFAFQRRNLYLFLTKEEIESWMNDEGKLRIRWFKATVDKKTVGQCAWEIYDIHQYQEKGPIYMILDLYTMEIEKDFRGSGLGRELFRNSLMSTISDLQASGRFIVGGIQIETHTAAPFYRRVLTDLFREDWKVERRLIGQNEIFVFWVSLH